MEREIREKLIELARKKTPWTYSQLNEHRANALKKFFWLKYLNVYKSLILS